MTLDMTKLTLPITSVIALLAGIWGVYQYVETTYAHQQLVESVQGDVFLVADRLEQKILTDRAAQLRQRSWLIEDRYGRDLRTAPETVKEEYRQIKAEMAALDHELSVITQDYRQAPTMQQQQQMAPNRYYDRRAR